MNSNFSLGFQVLNNLSKVLITLTPIFLPVNPASSDKAHSRPFKPRDFLSSLDKLTDSTDLIAKIVAFVSWIVRRKRAQAPRRK